MAGSNWNRWLDAVLAAPKLTANESLLAIALSRLLLGWNKTEGYLGEELIRQTAGSMHGRTFERARAGLVEKGLLRYEPGSVGKGNRSHYALILEPAQKPAPARANDPLQKPAAARANTTAQKPAPARGKQPSSKARDSDAQKPAPARGRRGRKVNTFPDLQPLVAKAIDAYRGHGGSLELADRKAALIGQVTNLARNGTDEPTILSACADLGRTRTFPGHLKQRADQITAEGGPCHWHHDRRGLTAQQLLQCGCPRCNQWADTITTAGAATA
jgi:hypothetical protein